MKTDGDDTVQKVVLREVGISRTGNDLGLYGQEIKRTWWMPWQ